MGFFPRSDAFQQVIYTPVGTIDVIATDQAARRHNARIVAGAFTHVAGAARRGVARALHSLAERIDRRAAA